MSDMRQYAGGGPEFQRQTDSARAHEASIGSRDIYSAYAARQREVNAAGPDYDAGLYGGALHDAARHRTGLVEQHKMFTRSDILAILRGQYAITHDSHIKDCITIFENLE